MVNQEEIEKGVGFVFVVTVVVVEMFTTEGINFSARSAKESGTCLAVNKINKPKVKK